MVNAQTNRYAGLQQQAVGRDVNFAIVSTHSRVAINDAASHCRNADIACTCRNGLDRDVATGGLQQYVAGVACGCNRLAIRLRHAHSHCCHDVNGFARCRCTDICALQQATPHIEADIARTAAQVRIQTYIRAAATRRDEHIANRRDTPIVCITLVHGDAARSGHQHQMSGRNDIREAKVGNRRVQISGSENAVDSDIVHGVHNNRISLGQEQPA